MKKIILIIIMMFLFSGIIIAEDNNGFIENNEIIEDNRLQNINIYFFGTSTCPYCADAKMAFEEYVVDNPEVTVYYFEIDRKRDGSRLLLEFGKAFNERTTSVPIIFLSEKSWIGFSGTIFFQIEREIEKCKLNECVDAFEKLENKENYLDFLKNDKYVQIYQAEDREYPIIIEKRERFSFFKKIASFFKNLFS